jgi:thymidine phosphorylase
MADDPNILTLKRLGIDTHQEAILYLRQDSDVCRAEGFAALARIYVSLGERSVIATLNQVSDGLLRRNEASLSESAWTRLGAREGDQIKVRHPRPLDSLSLVRSKVYGHHLTQGDFESIMKDIVAGRYADIHLSSFITACSARGLNDEELIGLTHAMVKVGERIDWGVTPIVDKHCVGGLPGNRTTPIIVAIVCACGLTMPKTSSRSITSPAGTADTMEVLAPVDLTLPDMRRVVEQEGGCIVWGGGAVNLSPADDILIRVERGLDIDSEGQLVASVLSKKIAAGSSHLVIDMPIGPFAKVRNDTDAKALEENLLMVADKLGLETRIVRTDGAQPVGRGIGPALEAHDVLKVLQNKPEAPADLRARSVTLAGALLELGAAAQRGHGEALAEETLMQGYAWMKFQDICAAQGGMREPPSSTQEQPICANRDGVVKTIDNRKLARAAKLAGAPADKAAGIELHISLNEAVSKGDPLFTLHAESPGELAYALEFVDGHSPIIEVGDSV